MEFLRRGPLIVLIGIFFAVPLFGGYQAVAYDGQVAAPSGCPICPDPCAYTIFPASKYFGHDGGTGNVSVTTQIVCYWTATSYESWISITSGSSGSGNGTVYYSVDANSGTTSRTGTMNIAGAIFTVNQDRRSCTYCIGPNPVPDTGTAFFYSLPVGTSWAKLMVLSATSGRLLFETSIDVNETRFPTTGTWDPVDNDGVRLANGPYLYVLIANGELIGQGKMVIQR